MTLLARRLAVRLQNLVDERNGRRQLGPFPLWLFPLWICALQCLANLPTCTPSFRATARIVPGAMLYSRRICSSSSTLLLLVAKPSLVSRQYPRNKMNGSATGGANSEHQMGPIQSSEITSTEFGRLYLS